MITLEDAKQYMIGQIAYLDKRPRSFVVVFFNLRNKMLPVVRVVAKHEGKLQFATKITSIEPKFPISEKGAAEFKNEAVKTLSLLKCVKDAQS